MLDVYGPDGTPLTITERLAYHRALMSSTHYRVTGRLLDQSRRVVAELPMILDGERTINTTSEVMSSASCTVMDRRRRLILGTGDALFTDRILQVVHEIEVDELGGWCRVSLFAGPCSAPTVTGNLITLEGQGMELWAMGDVLVPRHYPRGALVSEVIRDIMLTGVGESRKHLSIPRLPHRLPEGGFDVTRDDKWWPAVQELAASINCDLFYNMASTCVLRQRPTQIVFVFTGYSLIDVPVMSSLLGSLAGTDVSSIRNKFLVVGHPKPDPPVDGEPAGDPGTILGRWNVPRGNRFSAESLGHPDHPLNLRDTIDLEHCRLQSTADKIARLRGRRSLQIAEKAEISTHLIPHMEHFDRFRIRYENTPPGPFEHLQSATPWFPSKSNPQTFGSVRRVSAA